MFRRLACALAAALFLAPVAASALDLDAMTEAERSAFRAEIRAYLLENPEVLMEAIGVLEQRQAQAAVQNDVMLARQYADALFNDGFSYVGGNPDGDITLVEFMDYRCTYCRRAFEDVETLIATDGDIRFVIKEYPILGEQSTLAARFAIAVKQLYSDAAYKNVSDALMTMRADVTDESLTRLAEAFGLDHAAIATQMSDPAVTGVIAANARLGQLMQVTGTPTFVVQDQMLRGYLPLEQMMLVVDQVRNGS